MRCSEFIIVKFETCTVQNSGQEIRFRVQIVAEKAVPVTEVITEDHLKPFVKAHAQDIEQGVKQLTEGELLPRAEQLQEQLPELAEQFTEEKLKPAAQRLAKEIEEQESRPGRALK
jgi:hypothetical protein